uniref:xanthine dehydrogenase n=1 Tax=Timema monikensis TaxID=170555 RepID=A0A7R9HIW9_9NEOP|nr:unnamed protein product [Timema monikensis]
MFCCRASRCRVYTKEVLCFPDPSVVRLCGTKLGCGEGGCGACTVMVSRYDRGKKQVILTLIELRTSVWTKLVSVLKVLIPTNLSDLIRFAASFTPAKDWIAKYEAIVVLILFGHRSVNACLAPVAAMHGLAVTTVEGIGSTRTRLHAVQKRIVESHGSQCGFCTPGIVMSMYTLLRNTGRPTLEDLDTALQGNLCRCTGYRPILEGFRVFTEDWERRQAAQYSNGSVNGSCGMGDKCCKLNGTEDHEDEQLFDKSQFVPYDPTQEPIFPPELKMSAKLDLEFLIIKGPRSTWYRPTHLDLLLDLKEKFPDLTSRIVGGNSEVGVEVKNRKTFFPVLIHPLEISELLSVSRSDSGVRVGAAVTLTNLTRVLKEEIHTQPEYKTRIFQSIVEILHWFAGEQIRNVSAIGGNLMTSSPISDLNQIYLAAGVEIEVQSKGHGLRSIKMDHKFFTGYRRNVVKPDEVLIAINIPYTKQNQYFYAYKQSKRRDDDIAIVNLAVNVEFKAGSTTISDIAVACGGLAATTVLATSVKKSIGSLFFKAFLAISEDLGLKLPAKYQSATTGFHTKPTKSSQYFRVAPPGQRADDPVGRTIVHKSAEKQATGEAVYCDDIPHYENELYLTLVLSSQAHALIKSIDASKALEVDGTVAFFSARDIPDKLNRYGMVNDEEIFASKEVTCQGQVIGAIVAKNQLIGQQAAKLVNVEYEVLDDVIVTLEDAIEKKSYFPGFPTKLTRGDIDQAFAESDHQICGEVRIGGQEHFYLETHTCIAVPKGEHDELELFCSTQNPTEIQKFVAESLGILSHKVVCRVKRMGGGFGGKESRSTSVALPVALAAHRLNRPVRCMLDRDEDMMITGTRHPFLGRYKVAFTKEGKLIGCDIQIYSNGGNTMDLSFPVLQRSMFHFSNAYFIPNVRVNGYICKTNIPSNTAFRGFGAPQGMFFGENMIRDVASFLRKDPLEIAELNLMKEGEKTHYNQVIVNCPLQRCWDECLLRANFTRRKVEVDNFNRQNRWKKRGLSVVPTMFGISFTALFLNQAGALVMVYEDGSVLLSHGGTEMGQGLHTKMIQVASRVLEIPHEYVHITETSTDKVPNTSATAASAGSDLNGMAVMPCHKITCNLSSTEIGANADIVDITPDIGFDWDKNEGSPFNYYTFGTSCSEVEIDCLTGDHQVLRTDIVMDLGESLNPAIDVGQVEGGFVQGQGLFTLEETLFSPKGALFTRGPGWYKIPGFADIPIEFNVSLLKGVSNPRAIYSSKAVGEPPLFLAASIFFAIKDALVAARAESGKTNWFRLDAPATAERIRVAAADHITEKVQSTRSMRSKVQVFKYRSENFNKIAVPI